MEELEIKEEYLRSRISFEILADLVEFHVIVVEAHKFDVLASHRAVVFSQLLVTRI